MRQALPPVGWFEKSHKRTEKPLLRTMKSCNGLQLSESTTAQPLSCNMILKFILASYILCVALFHPLSTGTLAAPARNNMKENVVHKAGPVGCPQNYLECYHCPGPSRANCYYECSRIDVCPHLPPDEYCRCLWLHKWKSLICWFYI